MLFILAFAITIAAMAYGLNTESKFRVAPSNTLPKKTRLFIQRKTDVFGVGLLPIPLLLYFKQYKIALFFLLLCVLGVLIFTPVLLKNKLPLGQWLIACALIGIGGVTRAILRATIVARPALDRVDFINRHGIEAYMKLWLEEAKRSESKPKSPGLFETLFWGGDKEIGDGLATMVIKNEFGVQDMRSVFVLNGEYFDPKDGEWRDLPD